LYRIFRKTNDNHYYSPVADFSDPNGEISVFFIGIFVVILEEN
jgi:hypothetical protein